MKIAIIGFGPRGLACLEQLVLELSLIRTKVATQILIFDPSKYVGTGKAWDISQPESNYINISDHALQNLKGRERIVWGVIEIPSFPSYTQWCKLHHKVIDGDKDVYPPRSQMGMYLHQRATSICAILEEHKLVTRYKEKIISLTYQNKTIVINTSSEAFSISECLLAMGHTPTRDSEETKKFKSHAKKHGISYIHCPYETKIAPLDLASKNVMIKGFGLSMLDITRQLSSYKFGSFEKLKGTPFLSFIPENGCVQKIIPYSFDGLPCVPKPVGRRVDCLFEPSISQQNTFELTLRNSLVLPKELKNLNFLLDAFANLIAEIFHKNRTSEFTTTEIKELTKEWLQDMDTRHTLILDTSLPTIEYMKQSVKMACGIIPASLDFTIGQVWRHVQPILYRVFAFTSLSSELMKTLIGIDQNSKRYSYGPPVESLLQLIALYEASVVELDFVNDPEMELIEGGWKLSKNGASCTASLLINSVMDAPVLEALDSPIFKELREERQLQAYHIDLGVHTHADSTVVVPHQADATIPIAVIGRNAKGSVLGTDAILECFSQQTSDWAKGLVQRLQSKS